MTHKYIHINLDLLLLFFFFSYFISHSFLFMCHSFVLLSSQIDLHSNYFYLLFYLLTF